MSLPQNSQNYSIRPDDPRVIYIHSSLFVYMPNLVNFVRKIHQTSCGSDVALCARGPQVCDTTLVIFLNLAETQNINANELENTYYKKVGAFYTIEWYRNDDPDRTNKAIEIYNVCTSKVSRKRGIMKHILRGMMEKIPAGIIWLGIDLNNPQFNAVLHLYASIGFEPTEILFQSPGGLKSPSPILGLVFTKTKGLLPTPDKAIIIQRENVAKSIVQQYRLRSQIPPPMNISPPVPTKSLCTTKFYILPQLIKQIKQYYIEGQSVEFGGSMVPSSRGDGSYVLGLANRIKGTRTPVYTDTGNITMEYRTEIPESYITWHTHPLICYREFGCYIGWPSGQDMSIMVNRYLDGPQIAHILYTNEGIYIIQLSIPMSQTLLNISPDCSYNISQLIWFYFSHLEQHRSATDEEKARCVGSNDPNCLTSPSSKRDYSVDKIVTIINITTIGDMMNYQFNSIGNETYKTIQKVIRIKRIIEEVKKCNLDPNLVPFISQYVSMDGAAARGVVFDLPYLSNFGSSCIVPTYSGQDINYGYGDERQFIPQ